MKRVLEVGQIRIRAVRGQRVLGQIVRSDREKVNQPGQLRSEHRRRGNLHHDARYHPLGQPLLGDGDRCPGLVAQIQESLRVSQGPDHRSHDVGPHTGAPRRTPDRS